MGVPHARTGVVRVAKPHKLQTRNMYPQLKERVKKLYLANLPLEPTAVTEIITSKIPNIV
eukprot:6074349-Amphidinium_carterae.1